MPTAAPRLEVVPRTGPPPLWQPGSRSDTPTTDAIRERARGEQAAGRLDGAIIAVLTRPLRPDEGHRVGNDNRERELVRLLAALTPVETYHLRRRLDADRADDAVVVAFRRLLGERRQRVRAFLSDPRRRCA